MAGSKEIQDRMKSISDTMKITNAMYLISSSKLRKARKNMEQVTDYFHTIRRTIGDILHHMPEMEHPFLEPVNGYQGNRKRAYIVITADKGLAGAYNLNVEKKAEQELKMHPDAKLFVVGQVGTHYFAHKQIPYVENFLYSSQRPSLQRARNITVELLDAFRDGEVQEIFIIYTRMKNSLQSEPTMMKLLPLSREQFQQKTMKLTGETELTEDFFPDPISVFNSLAPITMHGIIFSALTESYCAELNDRMVAMDGATKSGSEMLQQLQLQYNRLRQSSITQEITEVIAGAKAQKQNR